MLTDLSLGAPWGVALAAAAVFAAALWAMTRRGAVKARRATDTVQAAQPNQPVFLFDGDTLLDASPGGLQLLSNAADVHTDFQAFQHLLRFDFPDLTDDIARIPPDKTDELRTLNGSPLTLQVTRKGRLTRIVLGTIDGQDVDAQFAALARTAAAEELDALRKTCNAAPHLMWRETPDGTLTWANRAYMTYLDQSHEDPDGTTKVLPAQSLFPDLGSDRQSLDRRRMSLQLAGRNEEHWFDISSKPFGEEVIYHAVPVNELVRSENTRRELMQTLSKTFAELSVGLAIFDRKRHLVMFNPALLDMTGLPFDFLSAHPTIDAVLNRMRDLRRLPEPKNYASWREQFLSLEAEAKRGTFSETWTLPDGQTFSVTGRPHPDGALAFIFEDISAEVSLTRHFRTEIETSQAVLDSMPDAIAVFSSANTLVMTNAAYRAMWDMDDTEDLTTLDFRTVLQDWKASTVAAPIWPKLDTFSHTFETRQGWSESVTFLDGRTAVCHAVPLPKRMTMIRFEQLRAGQRALRKLVAEGTHAAKIAGG